MYGADCQSCCRSMRREGVKVETMDSCAAVSNRVDLPVPPACPALLRGTPQGHEVVSSTQGYWESAASGASYCLLIPLSCTSRLEPRLDLERLGLRASFDRQHLPQVRHRLVQPFLHRHVRILVLDADDVIIAG